jgi:hypothetical protein
MNAAATSDFAENVATLLGGTELSAIDAGVRTDLLTLIGTLPADLAAAQADVLVQQDQAVASVSARDAIKADLDTRPGCCQSACRFSTKGTVRPVRI